MEKQDRFEAENDNTDEKRLYIAYGSNLSLGQMRKRCRSARLVGTSQIPDCELLFRKSKTGSYLTVEPKEGSVVPVAAWEVSREDELSLDRYEGYPVFYYKKEMKLPVKDIRTGEVHVRNVFFYIMHEDRPLGLPGISYVTTCLESYERFGFDKNYIYTAVERSRPEENE